MCFGSGFHGVRLEAEISYFEQLGIFNSIKDPNFPGFLFWVLENLGVRSRKLKTLGFFMQNKRNPYQRCRIPAKDFGNLDKVLD